MSAVNQDKMDKFIGHMLRDLGGGFLAPLGFIGHRLGVYRAFYWLQDERRRNVVIRELSRLNDYYLRDVGINRVEIDEIADAMVKRLRASRNGHFADLASGRRCDRMDIGQAATLSGCEHERIRDVSRLCTSLTRRALIDAAARETLPCSRS